MNKKVKLCPYCHAALSIDKIVRDPSIRPIGMAFHDIDSPITYYFFQHDVPGCGTSFLVNIEEFAEYVADSIGSECLARTDCCEGHCVNLEDLNECRQECRNAPFRRFLFEMIKIKGQGKLENQPVADSPVEL
nr:hypothetical protein [candidate division Zixibacteria bacterium]